MPSQPTAMPPAPPAIAMPRLSVSSWRTSRPRPAPMASRSAISRARTGPRLARRPATLAQATHNTAIESVVKMMTSERSSGRRVA